MVKVKLREVMARRDIRSQAELARMCNLSENAISRISRGLGVRLESINELCKALGCQPGDLLEYVPDDKAA